MRPEVTLAGVIYDTLGQVVSGATIRVRRGATAAVRSDSLGRFAIAVRAGAATLDITRDGFPSLAMDVMTVAGRRDTIDVFLFGGVARSAAAAPAPVAAALPAAPRPTAPAVRRQPFTLRGVVSDTSGRPLPGATVEIASQRRSTVTDSSGSFELTQLLAGPALVQARRIGFSPRSFTVAISNVDAVIAEVPLAARGQELSRVTVTSAGARTSTKLNGFFERKKAGFGQFITRDQFESRNLIRFSDLMNTLTGVQAATDVRGKRRIYGRGRCEMAIFLDGMNIIIPDGTSVDDFLELYEVEAVEVHNRVSGLPAEFSGRTNACGVVAAWTKSRSR